MDKVKESDKAYLDNLLDDVIDEFQIPFEEEAEPESNNEDTPVWTEDLIQKATKDFEATMRKLVQDQKLPEKEANAAEGSQLDSLISEFVNLADVSARASIGPSNVKDRESNLLDSLKEMNESCQQLQDAPSPEDVASMFNDLGLTGSDEDGQGSAGLFSLMQNMMESILNKNIIYPPVKELVEKFPDWLADNKSKLADEDYVKHNKQYTLLKKVAETYETEQENDTPDIKQKNFDQVMQYMQELQQIGPPPTEICGGVTPGAPDLSTILNSVGMTDGKTNADSCSIM